MGMIRINNLRFHTFNGVLPEERRNGQQLGLDIAIKYPIETKVLHDDVHETINYAEVRNVTEHFITTHSYKLIESLANHLLETLLASFPTVDSINIKIRKFSVPMPGIFDNVEIEVQGAPDAK
ncbi:MULTISPECIES: dihydroneopterin aldolase [Lactiplantibacillus]|jgi:dihydroneopterin aldolase|uniref:7,8-dihydroneopterin aldolase n=1 Tax=Lactiplantibacillus xiangfangensis TaxID=942150 RepID=A0A0R2MLB2_9LACO|nr:dihydroneopterin aldolase [Lactiplantibacillus xiangfangensis]KRO14485.1 dihydroneopterin aldolase [Lactiplantibacillus xiangfangensis]